MNTTTIITGLGTLTASTSATVDKDGNIDKKRRNKIAATTITTTATTIAQNMITAKHLKSNPAHYIILTHTSKRRTKCRNILEIFLSITTMISTVLSTTKA